MTNDKSTYYVSVSQLRLFILLFYVISVFYYALFCLEEKLFVGWRKYNSSK